MPNKLAEWQLFMALYWYVLILLNSGRLCYSNGFDGKEISSSSFSSSWAIQIPMEYYTNVSDLHALADRIAHEAGLVNRGQIGGLLGHYLFMHSTFFNQSGLKDRDLGRVQNRITEHLSRHPVIQWSRQEVVRLRYRRSLQFKDQYFPSQWHLVRHPYYLFIYLFCSSTFELVHSVVFNI